MNHKTFQSVCTELQTLFNLLNSISEKKINFYLEDRNGKDLRRFVSAMDAEIRHADISRFNTEREDWFNLLIIKHGEQ